MGIRKRNTWGVVVVITIVLGVAAVRQANATTPLPDLVFRVIQAKAAATPDGITRQQDELNLSIYLPIVQRAHNPSGSGGEIHTLIINKVGQGVVIPSPIQPTYTAGQSVTLAVIAAAGWRFSGWHGDLTGNENPASLVIVGDHVVTANFIQQGDTPTPQVTQATAISSPTQRATATLASTFTPAFTPTSGTTATNTPELVTTFTPSPVATHTLVSPPTDKPTAVSTATFTPVPTDTPTAIPLSTSTNTPVPPTNTPIPPTNTSVPSPTPINQPPVVDAGPSQTILWPAVVTLNGTVSDDGLPNGQLVVSWQKVTGPGDVAFTPVDQPTTAASFSTPGNYVLILIADDGALNAHGLVAIEVKGSPPAAPSNVQVTAVSSSAIYIAWTDNANNESGFTVDEGSTSFTMATDTTSFSHGDLAPASYHCYSIAAYNEYGSSAPTEWTCAETLPAPIEALNIRVRYEQRDHATGRRQDVPFQVTIKDESGSQILYQTGNWVYPVSVLEGNYGTATLLPSNPELVYGRTYQIFIRGAMHLTRRVTVTITAGMALDFTDPAFNPNGPLWGCDIDQDNEVDQADFDIWAAAVQAGAQPPPTPDPDSSDYRSDINGDHMINISDFSICAANMGKVGDQ